MRDASLLYLPSHHAPSAAPRLSRYFIVAFDVHHTPVVGPHLELAHTIGRVVVSVVVISIPPVGCPRIRLHSVEPFAPVRVTVGACFADNLPLLCAFAFQEEKQGEVKAVVGVQLHAHAVCCLSWRR